MAPATHAATAAVGGMPRTPMAIVRAVARPATAATCALTRPEAMQPSSTTIGSAATIVE